MFKFKKSVCISFIIITLLLSLSCWAQEFQLPPRPSEIPLEIWEKLQQETRLELLRIESLGMIDLPRGRKGILMYDATSRLQDHVFRQIDAAKSGQLLLPDLVSRATETVNKAHVRTVEQALHQTAARGIIPAIPEGIPMLRVNRIDPNVGIVNVPDSRLEVLAKISKSEKIVPAAIEFVDIAGLVRGASQGEGLGNQFLSHIREVDAIVQVVRCFEDSNIHHVGGAIDPIRDIEVIMTELILADLGSVQKRLEKQPKGVRANDKVLLAERALLEKLASHLDAGKPAITLELAKEEKALLKNIFLLTAKPTLFACNVAENDLPRILAFFVGDLGEAAGSPTSPTMRFVLAVREYVKTHHDTEAVMMSAQLESELVDLSLSEQEEYLMGLGIKESGVGRFIRAVYHLLGLRTYFTTGPKETRAWTIRTGDAAPKAAGIIHSDFERGFIAAETISYGDLTSLGSFAKARETGKLRLEGREYVVQDGDVVEFRFNV